MDDLIKQLLTTEAMSGTPGDIERLLAKEGTALIRQMLQSYIDARSALEQPVEVIGADGIARPHVRTSTRTVETPFGEIHVTRKLYRAVGVPAIAPLDAASACPTRSTRTRCGASSPRSARSRRSMRASS